MKKVSKDAETLEQIRRLVQEWMNGGFKDKALCLCLIYNLCFPKTKEELIAVSERVKNCRG